MFIVISFSCICLLLTFFESKWRVKDGMLWGFILVTILACIHYDYGNDYMSYYDAALSVKNTPFHWDVLWSGEIHREPGWVFLNYLFKPIGGFFVMVAVLNIIQNAFVYQFIKSTVKQQWWPFSVFIYLFVTQFYLINFSMMRQGFVVCVFLGMWPLIRDKKFWISLPLLYLLSLVHHSALILMPFAFWGYLKFINLKVYGAVFLSLLLLLWLNPVFLDQVFAFMLAGELENYYEVYQDSVSTGTRGLGFLLYQIPVVVFFVYLFTNDSATKEERSLVTLSMIGVMVAPFNQIIQLAGRMAIYFNIYTLFALPFVYSAIKNKLLRYVLIFLYVFIRLVDYYRFFADPGWSLYYGTFHSIFEVIL